MIRRTVIPTDLLLCTSLLLVAGTQAQSTLYPTKAIKLLVPFAAGGSAEIVARAIADPIGKAFGTTVVAENRGGGGGTIGSAERHGHAGRLFTWRRDGVDHRDQSCDQLEDLI